MPISSDHVGRSYPPSPPYLVTTGKIAEFATALGDPNPAYFGANGATAVAPPTFPVVLASWDALFGDPELDLKLNRIVHVEQKFDQERALRAGDEVVSTLRISSVRVRGLVDMITAETSVDTVDGEHVCTMASSLFHTREEASA